MLSFQNSGLMDRLFFFLYSQLWNISFSWTTHHRTQWLCTSNYWSWRFSSRKMKQGYRCHLSLKGPLSATVPKGKEFPSGTRLVVMWKGNESPHWDRGHDHICEANCHTPAFLVPWQGLSQSFLLGSLWRRLQTTEASRTVYQQVLEPPGAACLQRKGLLSAALGHPLRRCPLGPSHCRIVLLFITQQMFGKIGDNALWLLHCCWQIFSAIF